MTNPSRPKDFRINDLVWGKLDGYDYWPAQIIDPKEKNEDARRGQYCVQFIASNTYTFLSSKSLFLYKENREKYTKCLKSVRKCQTSYKRAIQLAEDYLHTIELEELCGSCCVEYVYVTVDSEPWHEEMTRRLLELQRGGTLTDIVMWDGQGNKLMLHSTVLAACSTFWQNVFKETNRDSVTRSYSAKCSPLNPKVWDVIIKFMYTGVCDVGDDRTILGEVIQQMTSMKLNVLLEHVLRKSKEWKGELLAKIHSYQQDDKLTDLVLVHHSENIVAGSCHAHMLMFMAASDYLQKHFASKTVLGKYTLGINASRRMWGNLVEFIYTGKTNVAQSDVCDMMKIAQKLEIPFMSDAIADAPVIECVSTDIEHSQSSDVEMVEENQRKVSNK